MPDASAIVMPKFGQTVEECTLVSWLKKEGDKVNKGELLFEIETDKATLEVESFVEGTLLKIIVGKGETVPVRATVGFIGNKGDTIPAVKAPLKVTPTAAAPAPTPAAKPAAGASVPQLQPAAATAPVPSAPARLKISPRAGRLVKEKGIRPERIAGTGPGGRIVEKDVRAFLKSSGYNALRITPAARKLAIAKKIDLLAVEPENGRIGVEEIERTIAELPKPMSKLRRTAADRLTHSFTTTPHFYVTVAVDMTDLLVFRSALKEREVPSTVTDFIIHAVIHSLCEFPIVNSSTDGMAVRWRSRVHLGLAVATEEGLVVPVIRNAENLSFTDLHDRAAALSRKAREGKLLPDEMTGSTFTLSNMGMMNVESFIAIINPGEGAILAVSSTVRTPVVRGDEIVARDMMKITLSADHRIVDGAIGAEFVNAVKNKLEDVEAWRRLIS